MPIPLVTVITPTYNRADYLVETIESVLKQNYSNLEYIILDDGSNDNTKEILARYNGKLIWDSQANMGETRTVNKGFEMAKGEYICVVNSDDPLLPNALNKLVASLAVDLNAIVAYPDWLEIDSNSKPLKEMRLPDYNIRNMLLDFDAGIGPGTIIRRSALDEFGLRDVNRKYTGDLEFWFRLASHGELLHVPEVLATHRIHPDSISVKDRNSKMAEELLSIAKGLLSLGTLPKELQAKENQILSGAYFTAIFYCPNKPILMIKYMLLSLRYKPGYFIYRLSVYSFSRILRSTISEQSYNVLRLWWRNFKKQYL